MFKLIEISGDELRLDESGVSAMVNRACNRTGLAVEGITVFADKIVLICSEKTFPGDLEYRFTALGEVSAAEISAELRSRYDNNFRTAGAFHLADGYWTLTEKKIIC
ncbi:MAG: hypothetical protein E7052_03665 [Lentisphaerae bacterium]|nr:hypothetical protein [Lentisphaerota bacterium]